MYSFHNDYAMLADFSTVPFEDFLESIAAEHFPLNDGKPVVDSRNFSASALSPFSSSSGSSSSARTREDGMSDSDPDSDVEEFSLDDATRVPSDLPIRLPAPIPTLFYPSKVDSTPFFQSPAPQQSSSITFSESHAIPIIASTSSRKFISNSSRSSLFSDSGHDAGDESDGNATDDEYVPSPMRSPMKRRRTSSISPKRQTSIPAAFSADCDYRPVKKARVAPLSRNRQAASPAAIQLAAGLSKSNFVCPECGWRQSNERMPDFKRHLQTHTRPDNHDTTKGWWCKGVRQEEGPAHGIPRTAEAYIFGGVWRVGGCQRTFARRDALKRHLDNVNVACIGRPCQANDD